MMSYKLGARGILHIYKECLFEICASFCPIRKHYNVIANYCYVLYSRHKSLQRRNSCKIPRMYTRCYKKVIYHFMARF